MSSTQRFSPLVISLHWLMLVLIVVIYACMEFKGIFPRGSDPRELMKAAHFSFGVLLLLLVGVRIYARVTSSTPPVVPSMPAWQDKAARLMHLALYGLMIGMPLTGYLILNAEGHSVPFFGLQLPMLVGKSHGLAETLEELHEFGASAGYCLIAAHAVAAIWHHHVQRDNTMTRMLPGRD